MNSKHISAIVCAAAISGSVCTIAAEENQETKTEDKLLEFGFSMAFDSKFLSYGLVDNNDPIVMPSAEVTIADTLNFNVAAIFDTTKYGKKAEYGNRGGRYQELDIGAGLMHTFCKDDYEMLPFSVDLSLGYMYEYHPKHMQNKPDNPGAGTQFITFEVALGDMWIEPVFLYERDIMRDNGTYLNLELGHTFSLIDGDGCEPLLSLRPSVAQGFGDKKRVAGYLTKEDDEPLDHAGLMDSTIALELAWNITDWCCLSGYVAYSDYIFDSTLREASRRYEATGKCDTSYNFTGGVALSINF